MASGNKTDRPIRLNRYPIIGQDSDLLGITHFLGKAPSASTIGTNQGLQFANGQFTLQVQLNVNATAASIQAFLRSITFVGTKGKGFKTPTRTVHITLPNSSNQSTTATQTIQARKKP